MIGVEFFIILAVLIAWAATLSNAQERISDLRREGDSRQRIIDQLYDAINGEWETKPELYVLVATLPEYGEPDADELTISN